MTTQPGAHPDVDIVWIDAETDESWISEADVQAHCAKLDKAHVRTRGILFYQNDNWVVVTHSETWIETDEEWNACGTLYIPRGMVVQMTIWVEPATLSLVGPSDA